MSLTELLTQKQVLCPCVYDCLSAQAAKDAGFESMLVSGGAASYSWLGLPDMAMLLLLSRLE